MHQLMRRTHTCILYPGVIPPTEAKIHHLKKVRASGMTLQEIVREHNTSAEENAFGPQPASHHKIKTRNFATH